jgi:serine/threonine protein kinase/tetratricopeptide (TPR) repeat protein
MNPSASTPVTGQHVLGRGSTIGRFQVLQLVGQGGMGEVYAAYDPELDRNVAIKLLRAGRSSDSQEGRARLMREAQAIARVSHPNVVIVYDAGTHEDRVFIAMEFVEGHTLGYWMHARSRTWPEVLEVFTAAGRGLAAAHERDLVHRDFKPDNVMIGTDGQVRVMDFGLVQLAGERPSGDRKVSGTSSEEDTGEHAQPITESFIESSDDDLLSTRPTRSLSASRGVQRRATLTSANPNMTRFGATLGTPAYMSPEQFRAEPTDAATDQFSFCIALYEALYGERPFAGRDYDDLGNNVAAGFVRSAPKGSQVPFWIREVVLRGLSVNPGDRWPSMDALLAQLEQQPAVVSRRRFVAAAAARLAGVWEAPRGDRAADSPTRNEIRRAFLATGKIYAKKAWTNTSQVLDAYSRRWSDLYVEACEATHVRNEQSTEVLDLRMACLAEGLEDLRALCRMFRQATPDVVENAVSAANGLRGLDRCENIELLRALVRPPEDAATRAAVGRLRAELAEVRALRGVGRLNDALAAVGSLRSQASAIGYEPLLADVLVSAATVYSEKGMADDGARMAEDALWTALRCRHDEVAAEAATSLVYQVGYLQLRGDAAQLWSRLAETLLERMGGHDLIWGWLLTNRSGVNQIQGRLAEALEDARRAVAVKEKFLGPQHPDFGLSLNNLALCLDALGETAQAIDHLARALPIVENGLGSDHPRAAELLSNYSELLNRVGRFAEAREPSRRALAIFERENGPQGLFATYPLVALGTSELGLGHAAPAVEALERAHAIRQAQEPDAAKRAEAAFALARALWEHGQDRQRALNLAVVACDDYRLSPETPARTRILAEVASWLAAREL